MNTSNIDLNALYFEYKVLTKITGEPTFAKLHVLFRELKANAAAVPCTLAGGANGYLGMLVSAAQYQLIAPGTPFIPPPQPRPLVINPTDTQYQIMIAKTMYETALREHQAYVLLQRSLIALVQEAIQSKYTNAVRNRITGQLPGDIRLLKNHLFSTYGKINGQELQQKYDDTIKLPYSITDPIDDIFNAVEDLCEIAEFAESPYSPRQQVNIGYLIVNRQPIFRGDVRKWMRKPLVDKTWVNFITHFRQAHQELRDTDASMEELGYQSANAIVEQIVDRLREEDQQHPPPIAAPYYDIPPGYNPPPEYEAPPPPPTLPPAPLPPTAPQQQANAVVPADPNTAVLAAMMANMQMMHDSMHQNFNGRSGGRGRGRGGQRGRGRGRGRGGNRNASQRTNLYCHTHGNCAHSSNECQTPAEGHQNDATFTNMMGGSNNRCFWMNP